MLVNQFGNLPEERSRFSQQQDSNAHCGRDENHCTASVSLHITHLFCGGSQKSIVSATGPDKYDANHKRKKTLTARRFINTNLAPEAALTQIHSVPKGP